MKKLAIAAAIIAALGYFSTQDKESAEFVQAEYCARVAAGVHTDYDNLCPAGTYNSYRGLPGDVACVGDGTCTGAFEYRDGCTTDSECEGIE